MFRGSRVLHVLVFAIALGGFFRQTVAMGAVPPTAEHPWRALHVINYSNDAALERLAEQLPQLAKLGITVTDITNAIKAQSAVNPAGQVGGEPALANQQFTYAVLAQGRLSSPEQFGNVIVRETPNGGTVRVKDVARVELGSQDYSIVSRLNGKPCAAIAVYQLPGTNAVQTVQGVRKLMDDQHLDALAYPTWSNVPRLIGDLNTPGGDNSQVFSPGTGFPAITVPMGFTRGGTLPAGLQLLGRAWAEPTLLRLAYAYEQATHHRHAPASAPPLC